MLKKSLTLLFLTVSIVSAQKAQFKGATELDTELSKISAVGLINGFGVAVVSKDSLLFAKGYGYDDAENGGAYDANTLQNIGSVSKTLLGIALLKAQEMGKLNLDDPINKYLDFEVISPYHPDAPIRIWHLATHTSTIQDTDLYDQKAYYVLNEKDLELEVTKKLGENFQTITTKVDMKTYLRNFLSKEGEWYKKKNFLKKRPGKKYEYSNVGAALAAQVIEEATGMTYDKFTTQYILSPLQMSSSGWSFDTIDASKHSKLYADTGEVLPRYALVTYPDGGLITSLNDFSTYLSELMKGYYGRGTLLKPESYKMLFAQKLPAKKIPKDPNTYDDEFNSGIFMGFSPKGTIGHTGSDPGITTVMFFDPELQLGHIVMVNTSLNSESVEKQLVPIFKAIQETLYAVD